MKTFKSGEIFIVICLQGMVEVVAENYHNIWAKKKKTELISKGMQMDGFKTHFSTSPHPGKVKHLCHSNSD